MIDRREFLAASGVVAGAMAAGAGAQAPAPDRPMRRIATEEAFTLPAIAAALKEVSRLPSDEGDMALVRRLYGDKPMPYGVALEHELLDVGAGRLKMMDESGVDMHLLSLTSPGVQMFAPDQASQLATLANDQLAEIIARHPKRFSGLAAFAPQQPAAAAREMERAIGKLKLNGFIVNSHTGGHYLDEQAYWPILEAAEALDRPIYIHPRAPAPAMFQPMKDYGMPYALWGYGIETGTHAVRIMMSGVLDRFPKLKIVIGHMGEGVPFWLWRLDFMYGNSVRTGTLKPLKLKPSEYFKRNFWITTSGVEHDQALRYCIDVIGVDRILWAIDHPYQPTPPATAFMNNTPVTEEERHMLFHGNAERIFHIPTA